MSALPGADEKRRFVRSMFDRIAPRYDRMNRLLSVGLDQRWRRIALDTVGLLEGERVIDLACGTGDLAELATGRGARVVAVDFSGEMLRGGQRRNIHAHFVQADAEVLPLADSCASGLTCGFALRNFASLPAVLAEIARVLVPGGRVAFLEVDRPRNAWVRAGHSFYFDRVVPRVGAWFSDRSAYRYLPESTAYLPAEDTLRELLCDAGFVDIAKRSFVLGAAQLVTATRRDERGDRADEST